MKIKIVLPFEILLEKADVLRLVVETTKGSMGFLPSRLDCVALLPPGIVTYEALNEEEKYVTIEGGILVKTGSLITVSTRSGNIGADLGQLKKLTEENITKRKEKEKMQRHMFEKLESGFLHRFMMESQHG